MTPEEQRTWAKQESEREIKARRKKETSLDPEAKARRRKELLDELEKLNVDA